MRPKAAGSMSDFMRWASEHPRTWYALEALAGVVLALLLVGCVGKPCTTPCAPGSTCIAGLCVPLPTPPPTPEPTCPATCPTGSACTDPAKGCQPIPAPGEVCRCDQGGPCCGCWHWPAGATEWQQATCPSGQECKAGHCEAVTPTPPPVPTCVVPPDQGWTAIDPDPGPTKQATVQRALDELGDRCGQVAHASGLMVVGKLNGAGECSALWDEDILQIRVTADRYEQYDVVRGDGCLINIYRWSWRPPTVEPPPVSSCAGIPRPVGFWLDCKAATRWCDSTPLAPGIEGTDWGGTVIRGWCLEVTGNTNLRCPYGPEGDPERVARERCGLGGDGKAVWHSDGAVTVVPENPLGLQATCSGCSWIEVCASDGVAGCTRHDFPQ